VCVRRWEEVRARFETDTRFKAVEGAGQREDLYLDYQCELRRADREVRKTAATAFRQLLLETTHLTAKSKWIDEEVRGVYTKRGREARVHAHARTL
jgi:hypothetical protein